MVSAGASWCLTTCLTVAALAANRHTMSQASPRWSRSDQRWRGSRTKGEAADSCASADTDHEPWTHGSNGLRRLDTSSRFDHQSDLQESSTR